MSTAAAEPADALSGALLAARTDAPCAQLAIDSHAMTAAEVIGRSNDNYIRFEARDVPIADPLPLLRELGFGGAKSYVLQGSYPTLEGAVRGAVLQGFAAIPDCGFTAFGASTLFNTIRSEYITTVVLVGA
ncbi:hypothetical protein MN2019_23855 [Mycolicibacterium neoaurum]|uniref:hypothetical protein n=1 Tax=Mycolicibacterium neoaurum TaxID=1795 RepID=UPI001BCD3A0D|nr:hypothetical protein [Mycolicibacterium neoaurum]QVI27217.1 hypothetical protein MN2019_23855 [Mycolicibacterium neoaurum]